VGYDHKKMAITSRGVWESVKRHFRELGKDVQAEDFTVVGVGDMAGDVFGNGMLMSRHIRLFGAFNHMHIVLDPNPDAAASFAERQRLFDLPRSTWADYDRALLSPGGGIFERSAKSIPLTPEVKERFGLSADHLPPSELIQVLLKAEVELLWFGGIGTYVKAREEGHADVGDRANDALRVNGADLRARVVGEGANLGMTQRGRIEYALPGGRLNTDFIDNSAGVDCSDHEVNIKILLGEVERAGEMTRAERNELLPAMTDEVAELVLRDNYLQTQSITVSHRLGAHLLDRLARFMRALERNGPLNRQLESLPDDDALSDRARDKVGFTRPELSVLLSFTKIALYDELLPSSLPDDPYMQEDLKLYFPSALRQRFAEPISRHRLRREIIATAVTNSIVNRVGITFLHETKEKTGMPAADIARAYVVTREVFGLRELWAGIERLDNQVPATIQATMLAECGRLIERSTVWFLREASHPLNIGGEIESYAAGVRELAEQLKAILPAGERRFVDDRMRVGTSQGVLEELSWRVACLPLLAPSALDIVRLAHSARTPVVEVGNTYFAIGERFGLNWLRHIAGQLPTDNAWDKQAVTAIIDDLFNHQCTLTQRVLAEAQPGAPTAERIETWVAGRRPLVTRTEQLLSELHALGTPSFAMLAVANRQLKSMGG
jgi:glutamate dehydrogenase